MNDLAADFQGQTQPATRPRVALLVDGDNMSHAHAGALIVKSVKHGALVVKRVYGNMAKLPGWDQAAGFKTVHAGAGKNATDLLLAIEAMALMLGAQADILIIATSDGDFSHLAQNLTERGITVIGIGQDKTPDKFRKSCTTFHEIAAPQPPAQPSPPAQPARPAAALASPATIAQQVTALLRQHNDPAGFPLAALGPQMAKQHGITLSAIPDKTWRAVLTNHPMLFDCDPKGPQARVRLKPAP